MKHKTTKRDIMNNYSVVLEVPYCKLQLLLKMEYPTAYISSVYGVDCDIYEYPDFGVAISTGYRPFGNVKLTDDELDMYEESARIILSDWQYSITQQREMLKNLLHGLLIRQCL